MARLGLAVSGKSLSQHEGLAGLSPSNVAYIVRRTALSVLAIGALVAGVAATSAAVDGTADSGVISEPPGGLVTYVSPTGYAWSAGIRVGQTVVDLRASDDPGGWYMSTTDGRTLFEAIGASADAQLRATTVFGIASMLLAWLGVLFLRTRRQWVLPAASIALLVASVPLLVAGGQETSTVVMAAAAAVPMSSFAARAPAGRGIRAAAVVAIVALAIVWSVARLVGHPSFVELEDARETIVLLGVGALAVDRFAIPAFTGDRRRLMRPQLVDVAIVAGFSVMALILLNVLDAAPTIVASLLLIAIVVLPATRRRLGRGIGDALLGDVREAAASEAAEAERARLARELHDVPLQELVAVIRRLEIKPGTEAESEDLRTLAGHLRNVATELRPPVLDDLGLPAAIDFLAEETTTPAVPVTAEVVDDTGFGAERRPPAAVELAMYRIASEAVGNALRHAGGSKVRIRASVAPDRVDLFVADDGSGLDDASARDAAKHKRLGLASMRRRAQAIDAELSINGSPRGTEVRVVWQA
jgi:signal transduction histidine kinase